MLDIEIRVKAPQQWEAKADQLGLREDYEYDDGEGNVETRRRYKRGVNVTELGTIWITPPVYDQDGETLLTPGVEAPGRHFNIRISNQEVENTILATVQEQGQPLPTSLWAVDGNGDRVLAKAGAQMAPANKSERAWNWEGIELIDMNSVATRHNVWL